MRDAIESGPAMHCPEAVRTYVLPPACSLPDLCAGLRPFGLALVRHEPRSSQHFLTCAFRSIDSDAATDDTARLPQVSYQEDPRLGQRLVCIAAPLSDVDDWLTSQLGAQALPAALSCAQSAVTPGERVATLGPWLALLSTAPQISVEHLALLRLRLADPLPIVRRATLFTLSYLPFPEVCELLQECASDRELSTEIERQLRLRGAAPATRDRRQIEDEIAASPLDADAYLRHAQRLHDLQQPAFAIAEALMALALARRAGRNLTAMLSLVSTLRPQVVAVPAMWLTYIAQRLSSLLELDRPHVVVEVAEGLLPLLKSSLAASPVQLAAALAHQRLGRPALAAACLEPVLARLPEAPEQRPTASEAAAAQHVCAELFALSAQLRQLPDAHTAEPPLHALQRALSVLPDPALVPEPEQVHDLWIGALLMFFPSGRRSTRRALRFLQLQSLLALDRLADALSASEELLADDAAAADAWLARAALLLRSAQPIEALQACANAERSLTVLDRLLEDVDPLAILRSRQAIAHAALASPQEAMSCLLAAITLDPRVLVQTEAEPALVHLAATFPDLADALQSARATLADADPHPRAAARNMAAACLRHVQAGSALHSLLLDFFSAALLLLDRAPPSRHAAAGMTLLASLEAQLDLLAASGDPQAQSPPVHAAMAAMADAFGL